MKQNISNHFIRLLQKQERKNVWIRTVCMLAALVVCGVAYALMLPAVTMENELACGLSEHAHSEECYAMQDDEQVLVCTLPEHVHDELCLAAAAKEPETTYYCGLDYEHQHSYDCYHSGVLVCTLREHAHSESCLDPSAPPPVDDAPNGEPVVGSANEQKDSDLSEEEDPDEGEEPEDDSLVISEEYEDVRSQPGANISFTVKVNDREVDPNRFYGECAYTLSISNVELLSFDDTIYYCKLDAKGFTLFAKDSSGVRRLEDYSEDEPGMIDVVEFWAKVDSEGYYYIFIRPREDVGIVFHMMLTGSVISSFDPGELQVDKQSEWSTKDLAYRYHISVRIPPYANFYDQAYTLRDWTTIAGTGYSPFVVDTDDLRFTYQIKNQPELPLYPVSEVWNDPNARLAYYQVNDKIYLMNRTIHDGACLASTPTTEYSGWCACWEQAEETIIRIHYTDTYAQSFFTQEPKPEINNRVTASEQTSKDVSSEVRDTIPAILNKGFDPATKECMVTVNESMFDLSEFDNFAITDRLTNAVLDGEISVFRRGADMAEEPLRMDADYVLEISGNNDIFTIRLLNRGPYAYIIRYKVDKSENAGGQAANSVGINNSRISKDIGMNLEYVVVSGSYGCDVSLIKLYDDGNPMVGAEFGLFSSDGTDSEGALLATSYTEDGKRMVIRASAKAGYDSGDAYVVGEENDRVLFDLKAGLRSGHLFYIQETKAPDGYIIDNTRHYFFVTSLPDAEIIVEPVTRVGDQEVAVLEGWELRESASPDSYSYHLTYNFETPIENHKKYYELPETGDSGGLLLQICGMLLLMVPCVYVKRKSRKKYFSVL